MRRLPSLIAAGVAGLGLAYAAGSNALGNVAASRSSQFAAQQLGASQVAPLKRIDLAEVVTGSQGERNEAKALAQRSLRQQALNPLALAVLGLIADGEGKSADAVKLLTDGHSMTRRIIVTELWMLERAVNANAVPEVLKQYDIVLRQSGGFQDTAFPILDAALADPTIEAAFKPYISVDTPWMEQFLGITAATSPSPNVMARMLLRTGTVDKALALKLELPVLFRRLIETGHVDVVRPLYLASGKGPAALLTSVSLDEQARNPEIAPVSWRLAAEPEVTAEALIGQDGDLMMTVKSTVAKAQAAAEKFLFLSPGQYRFSFALDLNSGNSGSAKWLAICIGKGAPKLIGGTDNLLVKDSAVRTLDFSVDGSCDAVQLMLEVSDGGDEGGLDFNLSKLSLAPASGRAPAAAGTEAK